MQLTPRAKVAAIVQARMGSTRLPGKVLMDLGGQTVLARVISRLRRCRMLDQVAVATTESARDDAIVAECQALSVECFRGSEHDVLDRYYRAAGMCGAHAIVRITSDCPVIDPGLVDEVITFFFDKNADYASNVFPRTYPRGLDVEVFTFRALQNAWQQARAPHHREHVTPYLYENPEVFRSASLRGKHDYSHYRWTLDTSEDLELLRAIYARFDDCEDFAWRGVIRLMEQEPELAEINSHIVQKAVGATG